MCQMWIWCGGWWQCRLSIYRGVGAAVDIDDGIKFGIDDGSDMGSSNGSFLFQMTEKLRVSF